jgi:hypothetical protein
MFRDTTDWPAATAGMIATRYRGVPENSLAQLAVAAVSCGNRRTAFQMKGAFPNVPDRAE